MPSWLVQLPLQQQQQSQPPSPSSAPPLTSPSSPSSLCSTSSSTPRARQLQHRRPPLLLQSSSSKEWILVSSTRRGSTRLPSSSASECLFLGFLIPLGLCGDFLTPRSCTEHPRKLSSLPQPLTRTYTDRPSLLTTNSGLGDSAHGWLSFAEQFSPNFPDVKWVLTNAPRRAVSFAPGQVMTSW